MEEKRMPFRNFKMVNREKELETCARRSLSFKSFLGKTKSVR